jgi:hypothetical protein
MSTLSKPRDNVGFQQSAESDEGDLDSESSDNTEENLHDDTGEDLISEEVRFFAGTKFIGCLGEAECKELYKDFEWIAVKKGETLFLKSDCRDVAAHHF